MTVCLVLPEDSAFPGARERMCSGFPYWKRPMLSMYDMEVTGSARLGGFRTKLSPEAHLTCPGLQRPMHSSGFGSQSTGPDMDTLFLGLWFALSFPSYNSQHSTESPLIPQSQCKDAPMYVCKRSAQVVCYPVVGSEEPCVGQHWLITALHSLLHGVCILLKEAGRWPGV